MENQFHSIHNILNNHCSSMRLLGLPLPYPYLRSRCEDMFPQSSTCLTLCTHPFLYKPFVCTELHFFIPSKNSTIVSCDFLSCHRHYETIVIAHAHSQQADSVLHCQRCARDTAHSCAAQVKESKRKRDSCQHCACQYNCQSWKRRGVGWLSLLRLIGKKAWPLSVQCWESICSVLVGVM